MLWKQAERYRDRLRELDTTAVRVQRETRPRRNWAMPPKGIEAAAEIYGNLMIYYFWHVSSSTKTFH